MKRLLKTDYENKIKKLFFEISKLEIEKEYISDEIDKINSLIFYVKYRKIDLLKLEELGLQRYNAEYGKRFTDIKYRTQSSFVSEDAYEELKRYGFIDVSRCRY